MKIKLLEKLSALFLFLPSVCACPAPELNIHGHEIIVPSAPFPRVQIHTDFFDHRLNHAGGGSGMISSPMLKLMVSV